jgi:FMN-dependent NADH-azoreductase
MQRGVTFGHGYDGQPVISNSGKRALTLVSSGGIYSKESSSSREHALSLSNLEFQYIGYSDVRGVIAEGMAMSEDIKQTNLNKSIHQLQEIDLIMCSSTDTISKHYCTYVIPIQISHRVAIPCI